MYHFLHFTNACNSESLNTDRLKHELFCLNKFQKIILFDYLNTSLCLIYFLNLDSLLFEVARKKIYAKQKQISFNRVATL